MAVNCDRLELPAIPGAWHGNRDRRKSADRKQYFELFTAHGHTGRSDIRTIR